VEFYQVVLSASVGDYAQACQSLDVLAIPQAESAPAVMESVPAGAGSIARPLPLGQILVPPGTCRSESDSTRRRSTWPTGHALVVRGLLALEEGDTATAERVSAGACNSKGTSAFDAQPIAAHYLAKLAAPQRR